MNFFSAKSRMTVGLACMLVTVLSTAMMLGMVPDRQSAIVAGRGNVCETIAVISSDYISRGEVLRLEFLLQSVVERNEEVISAGVRRENGQLVTKIGDHLDHWDLPQGERSTDANIRVPIRSGEQKWGAVELCFKPLGKTGVAGWLASPWLRLTIFVCSLGYLLFYFYLSKMLQHLDPSQTVPQRVRTALDSLAEGLLVIDREQRIVLANQSFATWVARSPEKLIGLQASKLPWVDDKDGTDPEIYPWVEAIRLEAPQAGVMLGLKPRGDVTRNLMANASPVLGHDGKYRGVLVSFDDVTELEKTKTDLSFAKKVAEDANQAKSEFLARMSHEIRTPMNAILGYTDVLRRGFDESVEDRREYLNTIHGSGEHLLALINDILDLSKIESGQTDLELQRVSPHKLISQVVTLLHAKAEEKGISLNFECGGPLPETILVDEVRLRQAIVNLAGNAIKFTQEGGVRIVGRMVGTTADKSGSQEGLGTDMQIAFDVIDSGIGISKEAQRKIFDPFSQADTSITRRFGGTGLGLAISKQLAEVMGGGISVRSEPGKGSAFTMTIDTGSLEGVPLVDAETAKATLTQQESEQIDVQQLPPARILIADDGESNRKLVKIVLARAGVEVVAVENGQEAVDQALGSTFDIILMDMQMPVMDGYTATTTLRESGHDGPIVALTAHAMRGDEEKCRAAGCSHFMTKPINIDRLLGTLSELLEDTNRESAESRVGVSPQDQPLDPTPRTMTPGTMTPGTMTPRTMTPRTMTPRTMTPGTMTPGTMTPREEPPLQDVLSISSATMEEEQHNGIQDVQREVNDLAVAVGKVTQMRHVDVTDHEAPIHSSYPMDDPDFREIAQEFASRLDEKLVIMREAQATGNFSDLAGHAHWLKGSGGTAGFNVFTEPAREFEMAAKAQDHDQVEMLLVRLSQMARRIVVPELGPATEIGSMNEASGPVAASGSDIATAPSERRAADGRQAIAHLVASGQKRAEEAPLISSLPTDDADFREIVEEFVATMEKKLAAMDKANTSQNFEELAKLAHWLKGCGGTAGFNAFTAPAKHLEQLAQERKADCIPPAINDLRQLAARILIPSTSAT